MGDNRKDKRKDENQVGSLNSGRTGLTYGSRWKGRKIVEICTYQLICQSPTAEMTTGTGWKRTIGGDMKRGY